ncbi:MAG TPA: hypothetical protein VLG47_03560 [Candidatus Saccharimonadales bacterium]|nr:hypothetical protein [Candidatus Saccharimonadales bacterium]
MSEVPKNTIESKLDPELLRPIPPVPSVAGWKEVPFQPSTLDDDLVPMGFAAPEFWSVGTDSIYGGEREASPYRFGEMGATTAVFVRRSIARRLLVAQSLLPPEYCLVAKDCHRSTEVQAKLSATYIDALRDIHSNMVDGRLVWEPGWNEDRVIAESQNFVSLPSDAPRIRPSPHNTGAVDVVIVRLSDSAAEFRQRVLAEYAASTAGSELWNRLQSGGARISMPYEQDATLPDTITRWLAMQHELEADLFRNPGSQILNFGTPFDYGEPDGKADIDYFELLGQQRPLEQDECEARDNRRMLYNVMRLASLDPLETYADYEARKLGMQSLRSEWWHFNAPETQMGAIVAGLPYATLGAIELSDENKRFAEARDNYWLRNNHIVARTHHDRAAVILP